MLLTESRSWDAIARQNIAAAAAGGAAAVTSNHYQWLPRGTLSKMPAGELHFNSDQIWLYTVLMLARFDALSPYEVVVGDGIDMARYESQMPS